LSHFLRQAVVVSLESDALVGAVGGPASAIGEGILGQGEDVEDGGFDVFAPALGEWIVRGFTLVGHRDLAGIVFSRAPLKVSVLLTKKYSP